MPSLDEHIRQAEHNERFVDIFDLKSSPYLDWALTGIFYSAIHYIEAALATRGKHPFSHSERNTLIHLHIKNNDVYDDHRDLMEDSRDGRYKCIVVSEDTINESKLKLEKIKTNLKTFIPGIN
jgi:uncharacterized protein (UPF0332 family)